MRLRTRLKQVSKPVKREPKVGLNCICSFRSEVYREMRPRPAHNGDALYDLTKHRDSPAAHRSGPPVGQLQRQGSAKVPAHGRNQSAEMNFSLYGYLPYSPTYISHESLNRALASPAKEEASRPARLPGPGPPIQLDVAADDAAGKPTSVIVEHRAPRHQPGAPVAVVDPPYRCRGSITHGTAAGVKPISTATPLRHGGITAAPPLATRDDPCTWSKKPTCVVNGLCWTHSQTVPSATPRSLSPPSKSDLISQGLVPNPLYSSAAGGLHRAAALAAEDPPKLAVAGVDYAVDMSAKRTSVTRCEPLVKRSRCDDPLGPVPWPPLSQSQSQAAAQTGSSYMDSFKSFVDHAVQSAFMDDAEKDALVRGLPQAPAADGQQSAVDQGRAVTMGSILRSLAGSPKSQSRSLPPPGSGVYPSAAAQSDGPTGTEPGALDRGGASLPYEKLAVSTNGAQPLTLPAAQMPSLVASVRAGPTQQPSTSPAAVNHGPPLLVPQCPIETVDEPPVSDSPALSTAAGSEKAACHSVAGDTDSDTLSAHSPAPVLLPAASTPPSTANPAASGSSLHLKKSWLLRYSDEDRKNATTMTTNYENCAVRSRSSDSEKSQDGVGTDEKPPPLPSTEVSSTKQPKPIGENGSGEDTASDSDSKPAKSSSEKTKQEQPDKKGSSKPGREAEDDKTTAAADGKDSIKNCFINCTYVSDREQDTRSLRRIVKDAGLEDKDSQSNTSKESDDSQVLPADL